MDELPVAIPVIIHNNDNNNNEYEIVRIISENQIYINNNSFYRKLRKLTHIVCFIIFLMGLFYVLVISFH